MENIQFKSISPFLRYAQNFSAETTDVKASQTYSAYDYRLYYCLEGKMILFIENRELELTANSVAVWSPGIRYGYKIPPDTHTQMISMNFDITHLAQDIEMPVPPDLISEYNPSDILEKLSVSDVGWTSSYTYFENLPEIRSKVLELFSEYNSKMLFYREKCNGILLEILAALSRLDETGNDNRLLNEKMSALIEYINDNLSGDVSNITLGRIFSYHPNHLNRIIKTYTGTTLHQYVLNSRISKAILLLKTTEMTILEISEAVGFKDFSHFSKCFKSKTGRCPGDFKL